MMTVQGVNTVIELEDFEVDFILKFIIFTKRHINSRSGMDWRIISFTKNNKKLSIKKVTFSPLELSF
jgi:hypothetical protein